MIVRLTVHDNDFTEQLENFASKLFSLLLENTRGNSDIRDELFQLLASPSVEKVSQSDHQFASAIIATAFNSYLTQKFEKHVISWNAVEYMKENFSVDFFESFSEKWENGESVYVFTNSWAWLSQ